MSTARPAGKPVGRGAARETGTVTLRNRQASMFPTAPGVTEEALADVAQLSSLADETPEGRSILVLAKQRFNLRECDMHAPQAAFLPC